MRQSHISRSVMFTLSENFDTKVMYWKSIRTETGSDEFIQTFLEKQKDVYNYTSLTYSCHD